MAIVTVTMIAFAIGQPELLPRPLINLCVVNGLGAALLFAKRIPLAWRSAALLVGILTLATYQSLDAGGISSPAANSFFYLPLAAAVLLGWGGAITTAFVCLVVGVGLVAAQAMGHIGPSRHVFGPITHLGIIAMYSALTLSLLWLATRTLSTALRDAQVALAERKAAEAAREHTERQLIQAQKMDSLGKLAGGIAHDFTNLLMVLRGNLEVARDATQGNAEARTALAESIDAAHRAQELTQRLLQFARGEKGPRRPLSLQTIVEDTMRLLRSHLPPDLRVDTHFEAGLPLIEGDATQLQQVVMNLCINAAQAMGNGEGRLSVSIEHAARGPGNYLQLSISDTGPGMPSAVKERIFEPFFSTKGDQGSGLGLSIVHGIVYGHGGDITVDSALGRGTTFHIYLPVDRP